MAKRKVIKTGKLDKEWRNRRDAGFFQAAMSGMGYDEFAEYKHWAIKKFGENLGKKLAMRAFSNWFGQKEKPWNKKK